MDAAADYADVRRALSNANLPAYVSYVIRSHAGFDAVHGDDVEAVTVRTSDGKIVTGKAPRINLGSDHGGDRDVVRRGPFDAACYTATAAKLTLFDGRPAEALTLHSICPNHSGTGRHDEAEFTTLYADPVSHRPFAVIGGSTDTWVSAQLDERFLVAGDFVLPARFNVKIAGSGPMFWLNVDAAESYSEYRFLARPPGTAGSH